MSPPHVLRRRIACAGINVHGDLHFFGRAVSALSERASLRRPQRRHPHHLWTAGRTQPRRNGSTSTVSPAASSPASSASQSSPAFSFHPQPRSPYNATQDRILRFCRPHIATTGFTLDTLAFGAREAGLVDAAVNLFPEGPHALVRWHLFTERTALAERIRAKWEAAGSERPPGMGMRIRDLVWMRLLANKEAAVVQKWQEALALSALPRNISPTLHELALLSDEIWYLAGDQAVDASWYTKRASLSTVYAASELFMTTDTSADYRDTAGFLDRRLRDVHLVGGAVRDVSQWVGFTARAAVNVLRSKGMRI